MLTLLNSLWARFAVWIAGGAAVLAVLLFLLLLWALDGKSDAEAERDTAQAANRSNQETIAFLRGEVQRNGEIALRLSARHVAADQEATDARNERERLAEENPDVEAFLDTPIPDSLRPRSGRGDGAGAEGTSPEPR